MLASLILMETSHNKVWHLWHTLWIEHIKLYPALLYLSLYFYLFSLGNVLVINIPWLLKCTIYVKSLTLHIVKTCGIWRVSIRFQSVSIFFCPHYFYPTSSFLITSIFKQSYILAMFIEPNFYGPGCLPNIQDTWWEYCRAIF